MAPDQQDNPNQDDEEDVPISDLFPSFDQALATFLRGSFDVPKESNSILCEALITSQYRTWPDSLFIEDIDYLTYQDRGTRVPLTRHVQLNLQQFIDLGRPLTEQGLDWEEREHYTKKAFKDYCRGIVKARRASAADGGVVTNRATLLPDGPGRSAKPIEQLKYESWIRKSRDETTFPVLQNDARFEHWRVQFKATLETSDIDTHTFLDPNWPAIPLTGYPKTLHDKQCAFFWTLLRHVFQGDFSSSCVLYHQWTCDGRQAYFDFVKFHNPVSPPMPPAAPVSSPGSVPVRPPAVGNIVTPRPTPPVSPLMSVPILSSTHIVHQSTPTSACDTDVHSTVDNPETPTGLRGSSNPGSTADSTSTGTSTYTWKYSPSTDSVRFSKVDPSSTPSSQLFNHFLVVTPHVLVKNAADEQYSQTSLTMCLSRQLNMDAKAKTSNNGGGNHPGKQKEGDRQRQRGHRNSPKTRRSAHSSKFQGQDQTEMKGIVIDHNIDHKTPVSQQFDAFYKAVKIAAGKMNPNLRKPIRTLKGLTNEDFTIAFPDAEKWINNGVVDVHKKELYSRLWIEEQKGIKKRVKRYKEDLKKMFDIMHGQLSSGITEKLKAKENWTAAEEQADTLKLLKYLKEICYRDNESSICLPVDVLMKIKKFLTAYQDTTKDPTKYVEEMQMRFEVMKAAGIRIRVFPDKTYNNYTEMTAVDKKPITEAAEQILLAVQIVEGADRKNHCNLQSTLKDEYCLKKDAYPINTSEALDLLLRFRTTKNSTPKQANNTARTAFVTNGETNTDTVQEAHQLLKHGIVKGEDFGEELWFVQIRNMEMINTPTNGDWAEDEESQDSSTNDEAPPIVRRDRSIGDSSTNTSDDNWPIQSEEWPTSENPRSENSRSEKPRSEKPRSGDSHLSVEDTMSHSTEFLLAQNNGKLDPNLLLLDSQASRNVISNKALLQPCTPGPTPTIEDLLFLLVPSVWVPALIPSVALASSFGSIGAAATLHSTGCNSTGHNSNPTDDSSLIALQLQVATRRLLCPRHITFYTRSLPAVSPSPTSIRPPTVDICSLIRLHAKAFQPSIPRSTPDFPLRCFQPRMSCLTADSRPTAAADSRPTDDLSIQSHLICFQLHHPATTLTRIDSDPSDSPTVCNYNRYCGSRITLSQQSLYTNSHHAYSPYSYSASLQSTPSLSSSSAHSFASGSRYPKHAHLKKSSTPTPAPTQAPPSPSSLRPWKDASLSACSSSSTSQSSVTSMSVSSSDSSVASSTQSAKKHAPRPDSKTPALKSPPLQPPALKQLVLTPPALQQPAPSAARPAPATALNQSLLPQSPSLTPSPSLDRQALRKQALAAANQAHSASFLWHFYGDGRFPTPSFIQRLRKSPAQTRVWNASPSPTHFFSKKDGRDKKSIHDVCRLSVAPVYALVNPADSDWRTATVESLVSLASACFQGSAAWTKSPPGQALRKCLIGLAKMSPECFDALYCEGNLLPSTEGLVWLSANRVLGSHWFFKTKPPAPAPSAASASSTPAPGSRS
eukprot:jgi/Psemu1/17844/gm1.17844_g